MNEEEISRLNRYYDIILLNFKKLHSDFYEYSYEMITNTGPRYGMVRKDEILEHSIMRTLDEK